ncbi:AAA family ATPase, partial [Candidatus Pacearchaeota archaeon]|nr:AAA family ATPase [Candidatus Pacearchaeota archaeon]
MKKMATLIILGGLPGVGKTYTCKIIQKKVKSKFFDSDDFAKHSPLFKQVDVNKISKADFDKIRFKFYKHKVAAVEALLKKHNVVVMDAVFDKDPMRKLFYNM